VAVARNQEFREKATTKETSKHPSDERGAFAAGYAVRVACVHQDKPTASSAPQIAPASRGVGRIHTISLEYVDLRIKML
jgi:hypothetical protein